MLHSSPTHEETGAHVDAAAVLSALLDQGADLEGAAELEAFAGHLGALADAAGDTAPQLATTLAGGLEQRGGARLLAAAARLGGPALAAAADESLARLEASGDPARLPAGFGALQVAESRMAAVDDEELVVTRLERPESGETQVALLGLRDGALVAGELSPPLSPPQVDALIAGAETLPGAGESVALATAELDEKLRAGARRVREQGGAVSLELRASLPIIALAVSGDPTTIGPVAVEVPDPYVVDSEDDDGFEAIREALLDDLAEYAQATFPPDGPVWRHGDFVAGCMLGWKRSYADGRLRHWTCDDVAEFLLDHAPRKMSADEETVADLPDCAVAFLAFLAARELLEGDGIEDLREAVEALRTECAEEMADRRRWGLAKTMVMSAWEEGVDPTDPEAMEAWTAEVNARPLAQRDALFGPPLEALGRPSAPRGKRPTSGSVPQRRQKQRAARQARRRNRR